jgi:hypothetical protein
LFEKSFNVICQVQYIIKQSKVKAIMHLKTGAKEATPGDIFEMERGAKPEHRTE